MSVSRPDRLRSNGQGSSAAVQPWSQAEYRFGAGAAATLFDATVLERLPHDAVRRDGAGPVT